MSAPAVLNTGWLFTSSCRYHIENRRPLIGLHESFAPGYVSTTGFFKLEISTVKRGVGFETSHFYLALVIDYNIPQTYTTRHNVELRRGHQNVGLGENEKKEGFREMEAAFYYT